MAASVSISASATSSSNFVTLAAGTADIAVTQATSVVAEFAGAGTPQVAVTGDATMAILGEEWTDVQDTAATWTDIPDAAGIWATQTTTTATWLTQ
jgi:hypothetical protein